jgi:predicted dehydrogenase
VRLGIVGCGYVFDHYMSTVRRHPGLQIAGVTDIDAARAATVSKAYGLHVYPDLSAMLADDGIGLILNLTSIDSHAEVIRAALEAGRHVYTEKPVTEDVAETRALFDLAAEKGLHLAAAPCNLMSDAVQTMWRAVEDGAVGRVRLVNAEFDDNPVHLMHPEGWRSATGAPWPWRSEYEHGCTVEHAGYHLTWLVAMFGPVARVTAFSKCLVPEKGGGVAPGSADYSVACLDFASGVTARLTCSIVAPYDQRMRVIGDEGEIWTDTYRHYPNPVFLERFSQLSLNARKARWVRGSTALQWIFGVGKHESFPRFRRYASRPTATLLDACGIKKMWVKTRAHASG